MIGGSWTTQKIATMIRYGAYANAIWPGESRLSTRLVKPSSGTSVLPPATVGIGAGVAGAAGTSPVPGCQTRSNATTAAAANSDATMSASCTEMKFDVTYCARPNAAPQTIAAGQVWRTPRRPSTRATSTSGTNSDRIGVCRPTIEPTLFTSRPLTVDRVTIGVASAPNATGAVFATSANTAARIGVKPSAINMTAVIATGVPKPANASISAPKQNAMMMAWIRLSSLTPPNDRRSTSKCPV